MEETPESAESIKKLVKSGAGQIEGVLLRYYITGSIYLQGKDIYKMGRSFLMLFLTAAGCMLFLLNGCVADHSADALAKARTFALDHTRAVPEIARNHIRYTPPEVQTSVIFHHEGMAPTDYDHLPRTPGRKKNPQKDFLNINFVWTFPGADHSIVVLGKGLRNFEYWEGYRVILKKVSPVRKAYEDARKKAVGYVVNNMLDLSRKEQNRVRFSEAEVWESCFSLDHLSVPFHRKGGPDAWKEYLKELKAGVERYQYCLVWKADKAGHWIVVTGHGLAKDIDPLQEKALENWAPASGMIVSEERFKKYSVRKIDTCAPVSKTPQKRDPEEVR